MKVEIPQVHWQGDRESIFSIDFLPFTNFFVTCGYDNDESMFIRFWQWEKNDQISEGERIKENSKEPDNVNSTLTWKPVFKYGDRSQNGAPNVVKFSPLGNKMVSAGVQDIASIWDYKLRYVEMGKTEMEHRWGVCKTLRGHFSEISDVSWSRDEKYLATGSIDNTAILWNVEKGVQLQRFEQHKNYVSGVTIDPLFNYIITQSNDKTVKVHKNTESKSIKFYYKNNIYKRKYLIDEEGKQVSLSKEEEDEIYDSKAMQDEKQYKVVNERMFLDDTECFSFSRRADFSPDGSFFILPCGIYHPVPGEKEKKYASYGFIRNNISEPAFILPSPSTTPLVVRFHPALFERKEEDTPFIDLPYISVFAIATMEDIFIYTTRSLYPYASISNIHYAELTDLAWTTREHQDIEKSGSKLMACSRDGFITLVDFDEGELGTQLTQTQLPENISSLFDYLTIDSLTSEPVGETEVKEVIIPKFKSRKSKPQVTEAIPDAKHPEEMKIETYPK